MDCKETQPFSIEVGNQFKEVEREILVYSSCANDYSIVRWPEKDLDENNTKFIIPTPEDYLLITLAPKHAEKEAPCWVELPLQANMEFLQAEEKDVRFAPTGGRVRINIGEGPQTWQLKVTAPRYVKKESVHQSYKAMMLSNEPDDRPDEDPDNVTVGDNG